MNDGPCFVYITTNLHHSVLYTGQTHDLLGRIWQHKQGLVDGFTKRYKASRLVYWEAAEDHAGALFREKQIKGFSRDKKERLIESMNQDWRDLYEDLTTG